jgi:hypothetical protein
MVHRAQSIFLATSLASILIVTIASIGILRLEAGPSAIILTASDALWPAIQNGGQRLVAITRSRSRFQLMVLVSVIQRSGETTPMTWPWSCPHWFGRSADI